MYVNPQFLIYPSSALLPGNRKSVFYGGESTSLSNSLSLGPSTLLQTASFLMTEQCSKCDATTVLILRLSSVQLALLSRSLPNPQQNFSLELLTVHFLELKSHGAPSAPSGRFWGHGHQEGPAWSQHPPRCPVSHVLVDVVPRSPITALLFWRLRLTQDLPPVSTSREAAPALTALCPDWLCEPLQFSPNPSSHFLEPSGSETAPRKSPWLPVSVPNKVSVLQAKPCPGSRPAEDRPGQTLGSPSSLATGKKIDFPIHEECNRH